MQKSWLNGTDCLIVNEKLFDIDDCVAMQNHLPTEDLSKPESE